MSDVLDSVIRETRQSPANLQDAREVRGTIAPLVAKVGKWQHDITMANAKLSKGTGDVAQLRGVCRAIAQEAASGRRVIMRALPERLRRHSLVNDLDRTLAKVEATAAGIIATVTQGRSA